MHQTNKTFFFWQCGTVPESLCKASRVWNMTTFPAATTPFNDEPFPICSPCATEEDQRPGSLCFLQGEFCERWVGIQADNIIYCRFQNKTYSRCTVTVDSKYSAVFSSVLGIFTCNHQLAGCLCGDLRLQIFWGGIWGLGSQWFDHYYQNNVWLKQARLCLILASGKILWLQ